MDGHAGHYAKWNKSEGERQILYDITYMWKQKQNQLVNIPKKKQTHRYREQSCGYQWGRGDGGGGNIAVEY